MGNDPNRVARSAATIIKTYSQHGVGCCLKHFPGHGSSATDTHLGLADITDSYHDDERRVYKLLIDSMNTGAVPISAVMTGHLMHNLVDPLLPASLSGVHTAGLLRGEMGFGGLVITDSIDMVAVRAHHDAGAAGLLAVQAGADIVLDGFNSPGDIDQDHPALMIHASLLRAIYNGTVAEESLAQSITRRRAMFR